MELLWEIGWTPLSLMLIAGKDEEIEESDWNTGNWVELLRSFHESFHEICINLLL